MTQQGTRYTEREFPPYTYVPGQSPHPVSDPAGHMYGQELPPALPLNPGNWQNSETYLYGVDLFNHGFYWESHEVWESLWHAAGRQGEIAVFLKGLIKLAAAGVKSLEQNPEGVLRHSNRAIELLSSVSPSTPQYCGLDLEKVVQECRGDDRQAMWLHLDLTAR